MIRVFAVLLVCITLVQPVLAKESVLTVDLAESNVDISTGFDGARLALFGVKGKDGHVAVVIKGPAKDALVRKKQSVAGVWMNRDALRYKDVPQFYDYALSDAEGNILNPDLRKDAGIGFEALKFSPHDSEDIKPEALKAFQQALVRNKQASGLFPIEPKDIVFLSDTFFKTEFYVPSNVPTGDFTIETFLIDGERIIDRNVTNVRVAQVGFSSAVDAFADSYSFLYAMVIVFIAVVAGWLSNAVRRNNN